MSLQYTSRRRLLATLASPLALRLQEPLLASESRSAGTHPFGMNYLSKHHLYQTPENILQRDFQRFRDGGLNLVSFSLYWYRLEGPGRGEYHPEFLRNVGACVARAREAGLQILITMHTLWGSDSQWCTPAYAVDPVTKKPRGLAVIHDSGARQAFLEMYEWMVSTLAGTPGVWGYGLLNEPWYYPLTAADREAFIGLIQAQKAIHQRRTGHSPTTIRFINQHAQSRVNMFARDWSYDRRLLDCLDWVGLNCYPPAYGWDQAAAFLATNVAELGSRGKRVLITEFGDKSKDDDAQAEAYRQLLATFQQTDGIRGWMPWDWLAEDWYGDLCNLWSSSLARPRAAYDVFLANPPWKASKAERV
jgi:hypothetical protein